MSDRMIWAKRGKNGRTVMYWHAQKSLAQESREIPQGVFEHPCG
jgi:hypothetical protein